jgi:hypothetical protein
VADEGELLADPIGMGMTIFGVRGAAEDRLGVEAADEVEVDGEGGAPAKPIPRPIKFMPMPWNPMPRLPEGTDAD